MRNDTPNNGLCNPLLEQEERLIRQEEFNLDIVLQLYQLRQDRGLSQEQLAELSSTRQQAISRMESTGYSGHSLSTLRRLATQMCSYVDVILVPEEKLQKYIDWRYQPVLMEAPPGEDKVSPVIQWTVLSFEKTPTFESEVGTDSLGRDALDITYSEGEDRISTTGERQGAAA